MSSQAVRRSRTVKMDGSSTEEPKAGSRGVRRSHSEVGSLDGPSQRSQNTYLTKDSLAHVAIGRTKSDVGKRTSRKASLGDKSVEQTSGHSTTVTSSMHSNSEAISAKLKSKFDVDAPRKPLKRCTSNDVTIESLSHLGLTPEQRAWAGIEALLEDNESIATKDVLPEEIVRAMSMSFSTMKSTSFRSSVSKESNALNSSRKSLEEDRKPPRGSRRPRAQPLKPKIDEDIPELMNSSFSSIQTDISGAQSLFSYVSAKNYVVQNEDAAPATMRQFLDCMANQLSVVPADREKAAKETATQAMNHVVELLRQEQAQQEVDELELSGEEEGGAEEDDVDEEDEEDSIDRARMMIMQYTRNSAPWDMPDLMNASFSSLQSDTSGIQSVISTAKNYVVQDSDCASPLKAFLRDVTRALERKAHASTAPSDEERMKRMYERDQVADQRRASLSHQDQAFRSFLAGPPVFQFNEEETSMPSLASLRESDVSCSHHNRSEQECSPQPPHETDWRSWVDKAFREASQASGMMYNPEDISLEDPPKMPKTKPQKKLKKKVKKKTKLPKQEEFPFGFPAFADAPFPEQPSSTPLSDSEEVITMLPLRSRKTASPSVDATSFDPLGLPDAMPTPKSSNKNSRRKKYKDVKSPLQNLKSTMSKLVSFGKGRRGSPASVLDLGRGEEKFFPTIDEDDEEDWGGLLAY